MFGRMSSPVTKWIVAALCFAMIFSAWHTQDEWLPAVRLRWAAMMSRGQPDEKPKGATLEQGDEHAGHDHSGHDEVSSLELSVQARANINLKVAKIVPQTFVRNITVPGMVTERTGWTKTRIVAPVTGIVTQVHIMEGEAIRSGQPLIDMRLTHEDLVQAQVDYLKILEELDVVNRELERLRPFAEKGAIPQKALLDREYEQQKFAASLKAQRESLLLHGLSDQQVIRINKDRTLQSQQTIHAPPQTPQRERSYVVEKLSVEVGRFASTGDVLLTLSDYSELYIEGNAFEQEGQLVADALQKGWKVTARVENHTPQGTKISGLPILYLSDQVDPASRTLHFYLKLSNELLRDATVDGHRFLNWRYKPGQRTQLLVPVEEWTKRIVLPADAVVQDGAEFYVFQQNGNHFDRRSVHVEYRDLYSVIIAQDGSLFPGDTVAISGAQQMLMALKNKAGGGVDPHAGHTH